MAGLIALVFSLLAAFIIWRVVEHRIKQERSAAYGEGFERGSDDAFYRGYAQGRDEERKKK